jgi:hypothetical protein
MIQNSPKMEDVMSRALKFAVIVAVSFVKLDRPADARILCDDNFQIINGQRVSTPYCEDEQLARALRVRGIQISGQALRANPELKRESCLSAGLGVEQACAGYAD